MNIEISPKEYERKMNWDDAIFYCQLLVIDGKDDWRLPNLEELREIYNSENDFVSDYHWSYVEYRNDSSAWGQSMLNGISYFIIKNDNWYVRAVRTI